MTELTTTRLEGLDRLPAVSVRRREGEENSNARRHGNQPEQRQEADNEAEPEEHRVDSLA